MNVSATSGEATVYMPPAMGVWRAPAASEPPVDAGQPTVSLGHGRVDPDRIARAAAAAEADFQRVKEQVRKTAPHTPYPPLESIDRLSSLLGKTHVSVVPLT